MTLLISLILSLIIAFVWFSRYSLSHEKNDIFVDINIVEQPDFVPNLVTISNILDTQSDTIEYETATSLKMAQSLDSCREYRECYKNALNIYGFPFRYAGNAKQITIPFKRYLGSLKFGENTKKVILFYPELVDSIHTSNNLTEIYVPFDKYEQTLLNPKFRDVTVVRMDYTQEFYEKISYALYHEHSHLFGMEIPLWSVFLLVYVMACLSTLDYWRKYSLNKQIRYLVICLLLTIITFILSIEANWLGWINKINPVIVILAVGVYILVISLISIVR